MKQRFNSEYDIIRMTNASLVVRNKQTGEDVFIHRNAFNQLDIAKDYRVVDKQSPRGRNTRWIEVLVWVSF